MFFKRLAAIVITLLLIAQLNACSKESNSIPSNSSQQAINSQTKSNEVYLFYTHNHYNDFREYLNYYGGWGEMFGNVTGGGAYSSTTNANPTPYVKTAYKNFVLQ